jgi:hypothetical protein
VNASRTRSTIRRGYPVEALERAFQVSQDDLATRVPGTQHVIAHPARPAGLVI